MRGHFAVGVHGREEGGEGREKCVVTLQWASKEGRREEKIVRGHFAVGFQRREEGGGRNSSFPVICIGLGKENARVT